MARQMSGRFNDDVAAKEACVIHWRDNAFDAFC